MKNLYFLIAISFITNLAISKTCLASQMLPLNKMHFWEQVQRGANMFNKQITRQDIKDAKAYGITFIRLSPDKFISTKRDFLIGDADNFVSLVPEDLAVLKDILDMCHQEKMPVILTMLSLPGSRWKQNNNGNDDLRVWTNSKFQKQAVKFWQDVASELKDHPAIIGYNILNEPHLEKLYDTSVTPLYLIKQQEVQEILFKFYQDIIFAIRTIDPETTIIIDSSAYGDPQTFKYLKPHLERNILYSFHMYEPYIYTNAKTNQGKWKYPGIIGGTEWNKDSLKGYLKAVIQFQKINDIPSNHILVGEFGGHRTSKGLPQYFQDLIDIFEENHWHFAFYAFREDTWTGMDYELGDNKLPWSYWQDIENGKNPTLPRSGEHKQFKVLRKSLMPK